jgi:hypothetical protein
MNKKSSYREQILYYLNRDEDHKAMIVWFEKQPDLEQPDILRELIVILKDRHEITGRKIWLEKANILERGIERFEEEILDKKLDKALFMMQFDNIEFDGDKILPFLIEARKVMINSFLTNPEDRTELRGIALKAIKVEKGFGIYDPANWSAVFTL